VTFARLRETSDVRVRTARDFGPEVAESHP
jgi:hypothetical protein